MRTMRLIAAAGLTGLVVLATPVHAQYYGWGYYRPFYPYSYSYYPAPYYAPPPPVYYAPPPFYAAPRFDPPTRHFHALRVARRTRHRVVPRQYRVMHRSLVNPLLGPLPGTSQRRY